MSRACLLALLLLVATACGDDGGGLPIDAGGDDEVDAPVDGSTCDRTRTGPCPMPFLEHGQELTDLADEDAAWIDDELPCGLRDAELAVFCPPDAAHDDVDRAPDRDGAARRTTAGVAGHDARRRRRGRRHRLAVGAGSTARLSGSAR